ncbi:MAG: bactofilin family protein [Bacillota bacterium]
MFGDKDEKNKGKVETILGSGTKVKGDINTKGSLRVEGFVEGNIKAEGDLFVGEDGKVNSEVNARNVIIAGRVEGDVTAHKKLEILPSGKLIGDIKTSTLKIEEGAIFSGSSKPLDSNKGKKKFNKNDKKEKKSTKNKEKTNKEKTNKGKD